MRKKKKKEYNFGLDPQETPPIKENPFRLTSKPIFILSYSYFVISVQAIDFSVVLLQKSQHMVKSTVQFRKRNQKKKISKREKKKERKRKREEK